MVLGDVDEKQGMELCKELNAKRANSAVFQRCDFTKKAEQVLKRLSNEQGSLI